jgi:predicted ATPase
LSFSWNLTLLDRNGGATAAEAKQTVVASISAQLLAIPERLDAHQKRRSRREFCRSHARRLRKYVASDLRDKNAVANEGLRMKTKGIAAFARDGE